MLIPQLISQLVEAEQNNHTRYFPPDTTLAMALCRMGCSSNLNPGSKFAQEGTGVDPEEELILAGTLGELLTLSAASPQVLADEEALDDEQVPDASEAELDKRRAARAEQRAIKAFGPPLHSLVIVGKRLHSMERDYGAQYAIPGSKWIQVAKEVYGCE